jgi:DNA polymerase III delta subunit
MSQKGKSAHQIAVGLHIPKKHVNDIIQQSANLDEEDLEKAFAQMYETELKLKTSSQEARMAMTLLVYHLCRPAGDWEDAQI